MKDINSNFSDYPSEDNQFSPKSLNTVEQFQEFLDKMNVQNPSDCEKRFPRVYNKILKKKFRLLVKYSNRIGGKGLPILNSTLSDFQRLVDLNNIHSASEFEKLFPTEFHRMSRSGFAKHIIYCKTEREIYLETRFNCIEDFQLFINENLITGISYFQKNYGDIYRRFLYLNFSWNNISFYVSPKKEKVPKKPHKQKERAKRKNPPKILFPELNNLESIQKYIEDNKISSPSELKELNKTIFNRARKLKISKQLHYDEKLKERKYKEFPELCTIEAFQEFINQNNILNYTDFVNRFPKVYDKIYPRIGSDGKSKLVYKNNKNRPLRGFDSLEDFQNFIDKNKIRNVSDLKSKNATIYNKAISLKFTKKLIFENDKMKTVMDFQKYIDDNNITRPKELRYNHKTIYNLAYKFGFLNKLKYVNRIKTYEEFKLVEDFQNFIDSHNDLIQKATDLYDNFRGVYTKAMELGYLSQLKYANSSKSYGQIIAETILTDLSVNFYVDHTFDWLRNVNPLYLDLYLPDYNIAFEIQGQQHFGPVDHFGGKEMFLKGRACDLVKYNQCKENGVKLFYFYKITRDNAWEGFDINNFFAPVIELTKENVIEILNSVKNTDEYD